jgi:hypothetical protein
MEYGMPRTTVTVAVVRLLAIIGLVLVVVQGTASGHDGTPEPQPAATPDSFIEIDGLGVAPIVPQESVQNPDSLNPQGVALTRVTLEPGEFLERSNPHWGSSVLYVETGTICYQIESTGNASLRILASPDLEGDPVSPVPASATEQCDLPPDDCIDTLDGCDLVALGLTDVVVHEGQSIVQSAAPLDIVHRGYTNVGDGVAVILIAQVQTVTGESAPCGGGCP